MTARFETFVALRYLMAKRKQTVISIITAISVAGVAAGVMALVVALAVNAGFRNTLQRNLLGATAHVMVLEKAPGEGMKDWPAMLKRLRSLPHVTDAQPSLYVTVFIPGSLQPTGAVLKGVLPPSRAPLPPALRKLRTGEFRDWTPESADLPPILLGAKLAQSAGLAVGSVAKIVNAQGAITPYGPRLTEHRFRVTGIFETGFFDLDNAWAYTTLNAVQRMLEVEDVVNAIELNVDDLYRAGEIARDIERTAGPGLGATSWMEQNRQLLNALRMEKAVTVITIGLIQLVAALNILTSLVMMVMEKHRDIAVLMSMGARRSQIRNIFLLQGLLVGLVGTTLGLAAGYAICFFANQGQWIQLDEAIYSLSFVPFEPRAIDALWISATALAVSVLATLYPAHAATRIVPVEALRYE